jgi:hypothetical protein
LPVNFNKLDNALKKMGGELKEYPLERIVSKDPIEIKIKKGVEIGRAEFDEIIPIAGLLNFEGHHAFLYINEPFASEEILKQPLHQDGPRFHLVKECKHLQQMHRQGRSERYVLIQNRNGEFPCHPRDFETRIIDYNKTIPSKLRVCQGCIEKLNYKGFKSKNPTDRYEFISNFNLTEFLNNFEPFFIDQKYYRNNNMKQNGNYTIDHASIREKLLQNTNYTCQGSELKTGKCDVQLKDHPEWLHMHHINGRSGDNDLKNIKILCISCHQRQPKHEKLKVPPRARDEIARRRRKINN